MGISFYEFDFSGGVKFNNAKMEHLDSLGLNLEAKTVLEVGSGIGLLTEFFEKKFCHIISTEVREENVQENIRRHPWRNGRVFLGNLMKSGEHEKLGHFDVVFCYGTLYHLSDPILCLNELSGICNKTFLLETCVSFQDTGKWHAYKEGAVGINQAWDGFGCQPSRSWIMQELGKYFPFVYLTKTQPHDENEFCIDWTVPQKSARTRAVFVASRDCLDHLPTLTKEVVTKQEWYK